MSRGVLHRSGRPPLWEGKGQGDGKVSGPFMTTATSPLLIWVKAIIRIPRIQDILTLSEGTLYFSCTKNYAVST